MSDPIFVYKNRTTTIRIDLGIDVSDDTITSQIRKEKSETSDLIGEWAIDFETDGTDGMLVLTFDNSVFADIEDVEDLRRGYMDLKRLSGGEPLPVFSDPVKVRFKESITS